MARSSTTFNKGPDERRGKGGARAGAGRPPNWFRALAREKLDKLNMIENLGKIGTGKAKKKFQLIDKQGNIHDVELTPSFRDQISATDTLARIGIPQAHNIGGPENPDDPDTQTPLPVMLLPIRNKGEKGNVR